MNTEISTFAKAPWTLGKDPGRVYDADGFEVVDTDSGPHCSRSYYEGGSDKHHWGEKPGEFYIERTEEEIAATARLIHAAPAFFTAVAGLPDLLDQPIQWVSALLAEYRTVLRFAKANGYEETDPGATSEMEAQVARLIDGVNEAIKQASDPALFK